MTDSLMLYQQEDIYECAIALDRMNIRAYFYDKIFNVIPVEGYIFRTDSFVLHHEMTCFGGHIPYYIMTSGSAWDNPFVGQVRWKM